MRKGDEKRQEMLAVAERLFCLKGYEATSIQDILDVLHTSKGGFYHYFASKEALLTTLFEQRALQALSHTEEVLSKETDILVRLNKALYGFIPIRKGEEKFIAMLLPILDKPEGRALRLCFQESLEETFLPLVKREIALAMEDQVICPPVEEIAGMVLHLVSHMWTELANLLVLSARKAARPDAAALLQVLDTYRRALERLLDAPFGSMEIISLEEWNTLTDLLMRKMLMPM